MLALKPPLLVVCLAASGAVRGLLRSSDLKQFGAECSWHLLESRSLLSSYHPQPWKRVAIVTLLVLDLVAFGGAFWWGNVA
jgi:hypothetical protein